MYYTEFKREELESPTRRKNGIVEFNPKYVRWLENKVMELRKELLNQKKFLTSI